MTHEERNEEKAKHRRAILGMLARAAQQNKVPDRVLRGDVITASRWKELKHKANRLYQKPEDLHALSLPALCELSSQLQLLE